MSRAEFVRQFHAAYGLPPHAYLINLRLRKARRLLTRGLSLAQAAQESGFFDQSHLSRRFVRAYGVSPGTYARAARSYKTKASPAT